MKSFAGYEYCYYRYDGQVVSHLSDGLSPAISMTGNAAVAVSRKKSIITAFGSAVSSNFGSLGATRALGAREATA